MKETPGALNLVISGKSGPVWASPMKPFMARRLASWFEALAMDCDNEDQNGSCRHAASSLRLWATEREEFETLTKQARRDD